MSRIAVIGAGAWGTALAIVLGRKKHTKFNCGPMRRKLQRAFRALE